MYDPEKHHRRSIRLKGYDYSRIGAYFVTICTWNRECLFGEIQNGEMLLNPLGCITQDHWQGLVNHYQNIELDAFVVMPNHVHGIVVINESHVGAGLKPAPTETYKNHGLPEIVRGFKTFSSKQINLTRNMTGNPVWQRNYYEHVIRNEAALQEIRDYIRTNPLRWASDEENPLMVDLR